MPTAIADEVISFFDSLFYQIFSVPFQPLIAEPLKRRAVIRQIQDASDAASQSLIRFFINQEIPGQEVIYIVESFNQLISLMNLEDIKNPNVPPESLVESLLTRISCPEIVKTGGHEAVYRVALHSVIQVLMLVGPVMAEWQKLNFSKNYELPQRAVNRLNQISEQLGLIESESLSAADERYELLYRDYLLQRFHRVEAGTVRMTTNLAVDLRELFVMPTIMKLPRVDKDSKKLSRDSSHLMDLAAARRFMHDEDIDFQDGGSDKVKEQPIVAIDQVKRYPRNVIIGAPGSGKSTLFEWLQLKVAMAEEAFLLAGQQAIPLLLRVRQLNPQGLPQGSELIEKATASKDRATLMPVGWIDRMMKAGRVLVMIDGLDETEPEFCSGYLIPWLSELCIEYPRCHYLVSSRPVGYSPGTLRKMEFIECYLQDFSEKQVREYTRHWCTSVRLAQNEPEDEARREGTKDGDQIVGGFKHHPYIKDLARNPLMLSAICLVNFFEGGQLPDDRALLYKLCVEGLLHHWDQRRGIHSDFRFDEKLRLCREVALTMQSEDRAEWEVDKVKEIFLKLLRDPIRTEALLEHIRYRTGLLVERRQGIFAFAHLTFQEYLAAQSIFEGNLLNIGPDQLNIEHADSRWQEVIPLYCGIAPTTFVRNFIEKLITQPDTPSISAILVEAFMAGGSELFQDTSIRQKVLKRALKGPEPYIRSSFNLEKSMHKFPEKELFKCANQLIGTIDSNSISLAYRILYQNPNNINMDKLIKRIKEWHEMTPLQIGELIYLINSYGTSNQLLKLWKDIDLLKSQGPIFESGRGYCSQAEIAFISLLGSHKFIKEQKLFRDNLSLLERFMPILLGFNKFSVSLFNQVELYLDDIEIGNVSKSKFASIITLLVDHLASCSIIYHKADEIDKSNYSIDRITERLRSIIRDIKSPQQSIAMRKKSMKRKRG